MAPPPRRSGRLRTLPITKQLDKPKEPPTKRKRKSNLISDSDSDGSTSPEPTPGKKRKKHHEIPSDAEEQSSDGSEYRGETDDLSEASSELDDIVSETESEIQAILANGSDGDCEDDSGGRAEGSKKKKTTKDGKGKEKRKASKDGKGKGKNVGKGKEKNVGKGKKKSKLSREEKGKGKATASETTNAGHGNAGGTGGRVTNHDVTSSSNTASAFANVSLEQMKDTLELVGIRSTIGKTHAELARLCMAFAPLIQKSGSSTLFAGISNSDNRPPTSEQIPLSRIPESLRDEALSPQRIPSPLPGPSHVVDRAQEQVHSQDVGSLHEERSSSSGESSSTVKNATAPLRDTDHIAEEVADLISLGTPDKMPAADVNWGTIHQGPPPHRPGSEGEAVHCSHGTSENPDSHELHRDIEMAAAEGPHSPNHARADPFATLIRSVNDIAKRTADLQEDINTVLSNQRDMTETLQAISEKVQESYDKDTLAGTAARRNKPQKRRSDTSDSSLPPRQRKFGELIRQHMEALLAWTPGRHGICPPSPPSSPERNRWFGETSNSNSDDETMSDDEGGPAHTHATEQQLVIMKNMLASKRMKRFRPDLRQPISDPVNEFCWQIATDIFIELVKCKEYNGLQPEEETPEAVMKAIKGYAKDRLYRLWRENKTWSPEHRDEQNKKQLRNVRRHNLKQSRLEAAAEIGGLNNMVPIIRGSCSDDETDEEAIPTPILSKYRQKYCKTKRLPWRSNELENILILLDRYRELKESSEVLGRRGSPSRVRRRPREGQTISLIKPAKEVPKECYDPVWLQQQSRQTKAALKLSDSLPEVLSSALKRIQEAAPALFK
ncbi:hypothetical protein PtA15_13A310 [Puccinia triticina]|uniref:Ubinuclein middle domain-containing protein n=1 Tax=Puccinia triticina TaxID=208348 RepID=A0ABY7D0Z4_9BASI|nr:uncharacterized protein PtA15_13A310 [Puccinia triticina]WAQ90910.1 hypothetical protein PtA15_13A310 [Puccinia triticina]